MKCFNFCLALMSLPPTWSDWYAEPPFRLSDSGTQWCVCVCICVWACVCVCVAIFPTSTYSARLELVFTCFQYVLVPGIRYFSSTYSAGVPSRLSRAENVTSADGPLPGQSVMSQVSASFIRINRCTEKKPMDRFWTALIWWLHPCWGGTVMENELRWGDPSWGEPSRY